MPFHRGNLFDIAQTAHILRTILLTLGNGIAHE